MIDWKRHIWWGIFLFQLLIIWKFHKITKACIRLFGKTKEFEALATKTQLKVQLKAIRVILFGTAFIIGLLGTWSWNQGEFYVEELPYWTDKSLKSGIFCVSCTYVLDVIYYRHHMYWYNWLHHSGSMFVFVCVFDYSFSFMVSRIYVYILGLLFTARWILHYASLYYYLGNESNTNIRILLYLLGLVVHAIFTFGQLSVGVYFKIHHNRFNTERLIFWIIFEIAVLPSQLHTFYDIYCIIRVKLYKDAFSSKMDRFSVAEAITRNKSTMRYVKRGTLASLSEQSELEEISEDEMGLSLPNVVQLNINKLSMHNVGSEIVKITPTSIVSYDGYTYSKRYGFDISIDSDKVCLYGTIHQKQALDGFFNGNIAYIINDKAFPKEDMNVEIEGVCNDEEYPVSLAINTEGIISGKSSVVFEETDVADSDVRYLELDGITYQPQPNMGDNAWD